jgi:chromosome segregation ATPase
MGNKQAKGRPSPGARPPPAQDNSIGAQIQRLRQQIANEEGNINNDTNKLRRAQQTLANLQMQLNMLLARQQPPPPQNRGRSLLDGYLRQIQELSRQVSGCNSNVVNLTQRLNDSTNALNGLNNQLNDLRGQYAKLNDLKIQADAQIQLDIIEIADLKAQIVVLKTTITNLTTQVKALSGTITILDSKVASLIEENMFLQEQVFVNEVTNTQNLLGLSQTIDASLNTLFSYLKKVDINPDVIYEKVNYREIEHEKLHNINKGLDVLFYSFYCAFLLIMICMGNIKREHFLIYLIVGLIPIVYPFLFKLIVFLMNYISNNSNGPKNAFIDINNTIYAYNI